MQGEAMEVEHPALMQHGERYIVRQMNASDVTCFRVVNEQVDYVVANGAEYYLKKYLRQEQIDKYLFLMNMQLGVNVIGYCYEEGWILMQGGVDLHTLILQNRLTHQNTIKIVAQLQHISQIMKNNRISHCDIKLGNVVILPCLQQGFKVALIDNEYSVAYGQLRLAGTKDINYNGQLPSIANEQTDEMGYHSIASQLFSYIHK